MSNDGFVQVPPNSTGGKVDCASLSVAGQTVVRQRVVIGDDAASANFATVVNGALNVNNGPTAISGTAVVSGTVNVGNTVTVQGTIDKISATVAVSGQVSLGPGTSNIGTINNISAVVAVSGNVTVDKISATATVVVGGFLDPSGQQRNLVDSANLALRVNVVAGGGAGANPVSIAAGTSNIGFINNISATVTVAGTVSLGPGTSNIGTINNISAGVVLAAGAANIGTINNISAAVSVTLPANIGTVNNISAGVVLAAGAANIGTINNISAAVVIAAGTNNIGTINNISAVVAVNIAAQSAGNILAMQGPVGFNASVTAGNSPVLMGGRVKTSASTTATAHAAVFLWMDKAGRAVVQMNHASLHPSATHGPKSVTLSASANTVLVASAGTACVFVDSLVVTSNLAAVTRCDIYETPSSAAPEVTAYLGIGGGGFTQRFDPPWQLSAGQALSARLKPSASAQVIVCVHFHVGPA